MKRTRLIDLFTNIKITKVSFISIAIFVALSISIILGFTWAVNGLDISLENYIADEEGNLHDLDVIFPYGFSDEDIDAISKAEGVGDAEGRRTSYGFFKLDNVRYQAMIVEITRKVDIPDLKKGHLPDGPGEIALDVDFAKDHGLNIGDTITLESDDNNDLSISGIMSFDPDTDDVSEYFSGKDAGSGASDGQTYLNTDTFTITAFVVSPEYINGASLSYPLASTNEISVDTAFYIDASSFDPDAFLGYTEALVSLKDGDSLAGKRDAYNTYVSGIEDKLDKVVNPIADKKKADVMSREETVKNAFADKMEENSDKLDQASAQLDENQKALDEGWEQIDDARVQISEGKKQLEEAKPQLDSAKEQLEEGLKQLESAEEQISAGEAELNDGLSEYEEKQQEWLDGYNKLEEGKKQLAEGQSTYDYQKCRYDGAMKDFTILKSIFEDCEGMIGEIRNGSVTIYNYEEFLDKWQFYDRMRTLADIQNKYDSEYDLPINEKASLDPFINGEEIKPEDLPAVLNTIQSLYENQGNKIITQFEKKLKEAQDELNVGLDELHAAQEEINHGQAKLDYAKMQLDDAYEEIAENEEKLADAKEQYNEGLAEYKKKKAQYEESLSEYEEKSSELESGESELSSKEAELEKGKSELSDAREKVLGAIKEFEKQKKVIDMNISAMDSYNSAASYSILTRDANSTLVSIDILKNIMEKLKYSLAGLFAAIGIFVCYSAITRIVYLQMSVIGTKKALGFRDSEVTGFYFSYTGLSAIIGCIVGNFIGAVFERVLAGEFAKSFRFHSYYHAYHVLPMMVSCALAIGIILLITFLASKTMLSKEAIELLSGENTDTGRNRFYENTRTFKRMSFLGKTIVNNCVNDKRRVFGTIVGITGCTALIVTAFTFSVNINSSFTRQFRDYYHFNYLIYFDESASEDVEENIREVLEKYTDKIAVVRREQYANKEPDGSLSSFYVYIPKDVSEFGKIVEFETADNSGVGNPNEGMWINYAYKNRFGNDTGESIELVSESGNNTNIPVSGYFNHYITFAECFASKDYYEKYLYDEYEPNTFLADIDADDAEALLKELGSVPGYKKSDNYYQNCQYAFNVFKGFSTVLVILYLILAAIMSFLVLLNLQNQFIDERKRELTVMLINGFEYKDAKRYIYSDTIALTVVSLILGTVLGTVIGRLSVTSFNNSTICMYNHIIPAACGIGVVTASLLTFIITLIALKKIDRFNLTDIERY